MDTKQGILWISVALLVLCAFVGSASVSLVGIGISTEAVPVEEKGKTFDAANSDFPPLLTAELDKSEVKRGEGVNVSGEASETDVVDIVVIGPRGLRMMPDSIASEIALADGFQFMTVEVAENNTFKAEIRIPEEVYTGVHYVIVLSPGEDGVYGATNRTGGELFDAMLDYIASKGGTQAIFPGKSTQQLIDITSAATFNAVGSDDLGSLLNFTAATSFGEVIKLNPIATVYVGEPLVVTGTAELENGSVVTLSTISGPKELTALSVMVVDKKFSATFDTTDAAVGTYAMKAEDIIDGNIDTEPFEVLAAVPSTEQGVGNIKALEQSETNVIFDMPSLVPIGGNVSVRGATPASGNLDIVIDDILMANNLSIRADHTFNWNWNTRKPLPNMGAYTQGVSVIKAYLNCHVGGIGIGDYVRIAYKHLDPDGVSGIWLASPSLTGMLNVSTVVKGGSIAVQGMAPGADKVDIVIIGPKGLKRFPSSFTSEAAISDGLFFTSANVSKVDYTFERVIRIPNDTDSGVYCLLALTPGRDGLYALTMREGSNLFEALQDYGYSPNDFVGRNQSQIMAMLSEAIFSPGSDDLLLRILFSVESKIWHVDDDLKDYPDANFTKIQDAVNASSSGDIIIVYNGTYTENVDVNKSITIVSASGAENTTVPAANPNDHVFEVTADYVNISGFTVRGAREYKAGIFISSYYCNISNNIIRNNNYGIAASYSGLGSTIRGNIILDNNYGFFLTYFGESSITNNTITNNGYGIYMWGMWSINNTITNNNISNNNIGLWVGWNAVPDNFIYLNNFANNAENVNNTENAYDSWHNIWNSTEKISYKYNGKTYTNYLGNYWDDYIDTDANNDGIWDNPYPIDSDRDYHPLVEPFENYKEEWLPEITSCDIVGNEVNQFAPRQNVYVKGSGLESNINYKIWIQDDPVDEGNALISGEDPSEDGVQELITTNSTGSFSPVLIWEIPSDAPVTYHEYDIIVDKQNDGMNTEKYNAASDGIDSASVAGFVAPIPELPTILLLTTGLLALVGYGVVRRRK
ncbi:MAG: hypothetical protein EFT35_10795 [Methanophagales archaeon ANME-1-THS]|nr:MAG: hypothetical protein EFT35_10795 [Methanophagales archaeon ANME-1-THS]